MTWGDMTFVQRSLGMAIAEMYQEWREAEDDREDREDG